MMDPRELAGLILATSLGIALIIFIIGIVRSNGLTITTTGDELLFLVKALKQAAAANFRIVTAKPTDIYSGLAPEHYAREIIVFGGYYPGEVLGLAAEYPELAQYLRERDHIVDAQEKVGEDQK